MLSVAEQGSPRHITADVAPLDVDGVRTVGIGSALWVVAFFVLLLLYGRLEAREHTWWLWTCLVGFGQGVIGLEYCRRRRNRLRSRPPQPVETSPLGAAGL